MIEIVFILCLMYLKETVRIFEVSWKSLTSRYTLEYKPQPKIEIISAKLSLNAISKRTDMVRLDQIDLRRVI